jgi:hypothetical protein
LVRRNLDRSARDLDDIEAVVELGGGSLDRVVREEALGDHRVAEAAARLLAPVGGQRGQPLLLGSRRYSPNRTVSNAGVTVTMYAPRRGE